MKGIITSYTFVPASRQVTLDELDGLEMYRILAIVNQTKGVVIYGIGIPGKGYTAVSGKTVTLEYDVTTMSADDVLTILYGARSASDGDPIIAGYDRGGDKLVVGNGRSIFRDGFASTDVVQPNPDDWDVDVTTGDTGKHIITQGGNSAGASYLRISLSPFVDASSISITSKQLFRMPMRIGFGVSLSQRIPGQEIFVGMVGVDDEGDIDTDSSFGDKPFTGATATIATNIATFTLVGHGLVGGDRLTIVGCSEKRLNVGPVVVTVVNADTFTVPVTLANGTYSTVGGYIRYVDPFGYAKNGTGLLFETATATNASFVSRRNGTGFRSTNGTVGTTVGIQTNTSPYTDAFNAASNYELYMNIDEVSYRSYAADGLTTPTGILKYTQSVPDEGKEYKIRVRGKNLNGITLPVGRILSIVKAGSTTATVTTDVPHGLVAGDFVQIYGVRDSVNFPNLTAQTVVASVPTDSTFTVVIGTSSTTSSQDGVVWQNQGSLLAPGAVATAIQSISRTNNVLTVLGSATMAALLPGEYVHLYGLVSSASGYEGAYKVLRVSTTTLELESVGADFATITTGGAVIKRTDIRLHFARVLDYTRHVVEVVGGRGNTSDINNAVPVSIASIPTTKVSQGDGSASSNMWSAGGFGGLLAIDVASAAVTATATTAAITPGVGTLNYGTYAHSFNIVVTAVSGTNPTLDLAVEESIDNGTNWVRIYEFPRITAVGAYMSPLIRAAYGTRYRYVQTISGTTPSFTRAINRSQFSSYSPLVRQFIDRTIAVNTLNSTTPITGSFLNGYNVDSCDNFQLVVSMGAITTTAPQFKLQGSEDGTNWYDMSATPITAVANSTVIQNINSGFTPKFVRAIVAVAGVAATLNYLAVKGVGK